MSSHGIGITRMLLFVTANLEASASFSSTLLVPVSGIEPWGAGKLTGIWDLPWVVRSRLCRPELRRIRQGDRLAHEGVEYRPRLHDPSVTSDGANDLGTVLPVLDPNPCCSDERAARCFPLSPESRLINLPESMSVLLDIVICGSTPEHYLLWRRKSEGVGVGRQRP